MSSSIYVTNRMTFRHLKPHQSCKLASTVSVQRVQLNSFWSKVHPGLEHGVRTKFLSPFKLQFCLTNFSIPAWVSSGNGDAFKSLTDPQNNFAFEMHQYLDSDGSGSHPECVSSTIGVERLTAATNWLKSNNFKGFLGEIGGGSNDVCIQAIYGALCHLQQQGGTWIGALWWAAGPWWPTE